MSDSILTTTKKILGIPEAHIAFDLDVITHLNSSFGTLQQLGVLADPTYAVTDSTSLWSEMPVLNDSVRNMVKTYVFLCCKIIFDPPPTSFALTALEESKREHEWRLKVMVEGLEASSA